MVIPNNYLDMTTAMLRPYVLCALFVSDGAPLLSYALWPQSILCTRLESPMSEDIGKGVRFLHKLRDPLTRELGQQNRSQLTPP